MREGSLAWRGSWVFPVPPFTSGLLEPVASRKQKPIYGLGLDQDGRGFVSGDGDFLTEAPHDGVWRNAYVAAAERTIRAAFRQAARKGWRGVAFGSRARGVRGFQLEAGRHKVHYINPMGWGENAEHPATIQENLRDCQSWCQTVGCGWRPTAASWLMALYRRDHQGREFDGVCRQIPPAYRPMVIRSYIGGPILVAKGEASPCVGWDRIRAYSNAMKCQLPVGPPIAAKWKTWPRLRKGMSVVDATVRVRRDLDLPPLPVRMEGTPSSIQRVSFAVTGPTSTSTGWSAEGTAKSCASTTPACSTPPPSWLR